MASTFQALIIAALILCRAARRLRILFGGHGRLNSSETHEAEFTEECLAQKKKFKSKCLEKFFAKVGGAGRYNKSDFLTLCDADWFVGSRFGPRHLDESKFILAKSLFTWPEECEQIRAKASPIQPCLWTAGMIGLQGFVDFLTSNLNFRLLHHGSARLSQGSIFGASMTAADELENCGDSFSKAMWQTGSTAYAEFYANHFWTDAEKMCERFKQSWRTKAQSWLAKSTPAFGMAVFIGHTFDQDRPGDKKRRPGSDSILFKYELPSVLRSIQERARSASSADIALKEAGGLAFLNFSPKSCKDLYNTQVGGFSPDDTDDGKLVDELLDLRYYFEPLAGLLSDREREVGLVLDICVKCKVADYSVGPSRVEIESCVGEARQRKKNARVRGAITSDAYEFSE